MHQMTKRFAVVQLTCILLLIAGRSNAEETPLTLRVCGKVVSAGVPFCGRASMRFEILDKDEIPLWDSEQLVVNVKVGQYEVHLGDTSQNMKPIAMEIINGLQLRLRTWFDDGVNGEQLLS